MKVFILVRNTEEYVYSDFDDIDVFQSVHLSVESAEKKMEELKMNCNEYTFKILEREPT